MAVYETVLVPTLLYGCEARVCHQEKHKSKPGLTAYNACISHPQLQRQEKTSSNEVQETNENVVLSNHLTGFLEIVSVLDTVIWISQAVKNLLPETVTQCFEKAGFSMSKVTSSVGNENDQPDLQNCVNEVAFNKCNAEYSINVENNVQTEPDTMDINALNEHFEKSWKGDEEEENDIALEEKCSVKIYQDAVKSLKELQSMFNIGGEQAYVDKISETVCRFNGRNLGLDQVDLSGIVAITFVGKELPFYVDMCFSRVEVKPYPGKTLNATVVMQQPLGELCYLRNVILGVHFARRRIQIQQMVRFSDLCAVIPKHQVKELSIMLPITHRDPGRSIISRLKDRISGWTRLIFADRNSRNLFLFLLLNLSFAFVELSYGIFTNSLGLISDSFHMFFDCTGLLAGLAATVITRWRANDKFSYGYVRAEVLAGFVNGLFLLFIAFFIMSEAVERAIEPPEVKHERLFVVSVLGLLVNLVGIYAFQHGHGHSHGGSSHGHSHGGGSAHSHNNAHNHGHDVGDFSGNPICSMFIALLIAISVLALIKDSVLILMQRQPAALDGVLPQCYQKVACLAGVYSIQEPHFWTLCSDVYVGAVKLEVSKEADHKYIVSHTHMIFAAVGVKQLYVQLDYTPM
ncbi:unnamed protein product [Timema podura]|uniref:Cation efflux protein transmembrane domain-containing protein n=1 Tax=Timema podura TaxID=61482 RepID=A0ABN7NHW8_TIMPD|nr:unnamed protein product [Timema podura]